MSWFDSSFSFAKTALSQAQKSIDKVLDIKEEHGSPPTVSASGKPSMKCGCALIRIFIASYLRSEQ